ncbi:hypothetical protein IMG5_103450 [Ichthyophthirius multifiliis]|uniref:Uncharacterized protein n=1 Tax=Ichthyophthirius multifiliis TaxID=5932 RepID=G0QST4_ICHMU|nr:hypothetical protein IMG5_103450 [Ichthyophthirius multifiliis]EGR31701.1 hypothetical protein IMG5_103450 [Ichthyophthirius multifiliis]|eukprot:XP_004035187.1 hypothetical protein IMG5_103450 [Ichthyophthirius multifiliis]
MKGTIYLFNSQTLQEDDYKGLQWIEDIKISPDETLVAFGAHDCASTVEIFEIKGNKFGPKVVACVRSNTQRIMASGEVNGIINLYQYPACVSKQLHTSYIGHTGRITRLRFTADDQFLITVGGQDMSVMIWEVKNLNSNVIQDELMNEDDDLALEDIGNLKGKQLRVAGEKFGKQKQILKKDEDTDDIFGKEEIEKGDEFMAIKPWLGAIKEPSNYYKDPLNQSKEPPIQLQIDYVHGYRSKDCRDNIFYLNYGGIVYHAAALGIVLDIQNNTQKFFDLHNNDIAAIAIHQDKIRVATGEIGPKPSIYVWNTTTLLHQCHFKGQLAKGISALAFSPNGDKLIAADIDVDHKIAIFNINAKSKNGGVLLISEKTGPSQIFNIKWRNDNEFAFAGTKLFKVYQVNQSNQLQSSKGVWGKSQCSNLLISLNVFGEDYLCGAVDGSLQVFKGNQLSLFKKLHDKALDSIFVQNSQNQSSQYIFTGGRDCKINILDKTYNLILIIPVEEQLKSQIILNSACSEIRAMCLSQDCKSLLVGTFGSEIYEFTTKDIKLNNSTKFGTVKNLIRGHYCPNKQQLNEVWGLATFPNNNDLFATCSDDGTLRVWSVSQRKQDKMIRTNLDASKNEIPNNSQGGNLQDNIKGKCIAIKYDGEYIAVGFKDGTLRLYDQNLNQVQCVRSAKEWISDVKFSPDGTTLAAGSHDNAIYIHNIPDLKLKVKPLRKHSSYITHIDFSQDGNVLHSNCGAYELLYWNINQAKQITSGATSLRNEFWATWTATLGWPVQGIWPEAADGTDVNSVDRSNATFMGNINPPDNYYLLATGDDFSKLKVFRYPCVQKGSKAIIGKGHSSFVTNVKFSNNDQYIFSVGGEDNCVFQWKIIYKNK